MNTMSLKEKAAMAILAMVAAYALAIATWFMYSEAAWKKSSKLYHKAVETYEKETKLISERRKWTDAYEEEKARMPMFETGKSTDTTWLAKMDSLAEKHHIFISQRQGGKEIEAGDVMELPIEVKNWEGALESLVHFMYELENSEEGMFDIRQISFKPSNKKGYLKGTFTLTCAYMREN
ncbi:MAG: hypothetical protein MJ109_06810 [Kiritimatiellae bacterium]|nr:hypothetical protein [Kiritimatiellia bacterium]